MEAMKFRIDDDRVFLTLEKGDYINRTLETFADIKGVGCAWINGIGAIEDPEIGYYSWESKSYHHKIFHGDYELTSLLGNITLKEGKYFSHTHITFSDTNYKVFGGHLFDAKIKAAGEFVMIPGNENIIRKMNPEIRFPLWCLDNKV